MPKNEKHSVQVIYEPETPQVMYTNLVQVNTGPYDVRITLGRRNLERVSEDSVTVSDAIHVYMSPQHAKALASLLGSQLAAYEERFGPIPIDTHATTTDLEAAKEGSGEAADEGGEG